MFGISKLYLYGIAAALLIAFIGVQQYRVHSAQAETAKVKTELAQVREAIAMERADFEAAARKAERESAERIAAIAAAHEKELSDAQAKSEAIAADLRSGQLRLRQQWQGCVATSSLSATIASAASADADADLRRSGAGDLVRAVDQCEAQVRGLQRVVLDDRK